MCVSSNSGCFEQVLRSFPEEHVFLLSGLAGAANTKNRVSKRAEIGVWPRSSKNTDLAGLCFEQFGACPELTNEGLLRIPELGFSDRGLTGLDRESDSAQEHGRASSHICVTNTECLSELMLCARSEMPEDRTRFRRARDPSYELGLGEPLSHLTHLE